MRLIRIASLIYLIFCVWSLFSCSHSEIKSVIPVEKNIYLTRCTLLDSNFEVIRKLSNGWFCIPKADGGWISSDHLTLTNYAGDGTVIWKRKGFYHHQMEILNEHDLIALSSEVNVIHHTLVKTDVVQKLSLHDGTLITSYSLFNELYKTKSLQNSIFDNKPEPTGLSSNFFGAKLEQSHLNSIDLFQRNLIINDVHRGAFVLNEDLKFIKFVEPESVSFAGWPRIFHDFQILKDGSHLFFKNFSRDQEDPKLKTFKIFEIKDSTITFEFPKNKIDYVEIDCCGGVEKIGNQYLVGFPTKSKITDESVVGLVASNSSWVIKKKLPFRIQDIKKIPYPNYLQLNKIR